MKQIIILFVIALLINGCDMLPVNNSASFLANPQLALVIGNSDYEYNPLKNPVNDAKDMARLLREIGFDVTLKINLSHGEMKNAIRNFRRRLSYTQAKEETVGLFYFSGHGTCSLENENCLIPTNNSNIRNRHDLKRKAFNTERLIKRMAKTNNKGTNIYILDACRDNPYQNYLIDTSSNILTLNSTNLNSLFPHSTLSTSGNTLISFASNEAKLVADDGDGRNSLYTKHLLRALETEKHRPIEYMFKQVGQSVQKESKGQQNPWYDASLKTEYCFGGCDNGSSDIHRQDVTTIERYPTIECHDQVNVGQEFTVQISLTEGLVTPQVNINPSPDATVTKEGQLAVSLSDDQDRWEIEVVLSASAFYFRSPDSAKIILPREGDSTPPALFRLIPKPIQQLKQVQKLRATLWHKGTYLARIMRDITVVNEQNVSHVVNESKENVLPTKPPLVNSPYTNATSTFAPPLPTPKEKRSKKPKQVFNLGLQSPDMTVYLEHKISRISVHSKELIRLAGSLAKVDGLSKWLNDNYGKFTRASQKVAVSITNQGSISQLERKRNVALMKGFGRHLYDKYAPQEFKKAFWALKDKLGDKFDTIHIFTDNPIIPWELMIPRRGNDELDFLGIDFQIARWHISEKQELARPLQSLNLQKLFAIMPEYPDDNLTMARNELKMLQTMTGFQRVGGNYNAFSKLFKTSSTDNSIIHFSGHGIVQNQRYAIKLEDGELDLMTFRGIIPHPPKTHPLFFFNACDIGQAHHVANFVDGWAPAVLEAGASGYIGGLWPLTNIGATKFADLFYQQLKKSLARQPTNVADILRQTRKHFYDNGDPTFLGYVYYGDPHFRLVR